MSRTEPSELAERGRRVLVLEADAIHRVAERLGPAFSAAVRLLEKATGRLIVSGVGKSGLIARKIAATLTSTGSPPSFLHPVASPHGDLGPAGRDAAATWLSTRGASHGTLWSGGGGGRRREPRGRGYRGRPDAAHGADRSVPRHPSARCDDPDPEEHDGRRARRRRGTADGAARDHGSARARRRAQSGRYGPL